MSVLPGHGFRGGRRMTLDKMIDLPKSEFIEIMISGYDGNYRVWINDNEKCLFRAYNVKKVVVNGGLSNTGQKF
jgi:hypothetical protein